MSKDEIRHCSRCKVNEGEIFQINGDYCLSCWAEITDPGIWIEHR